MNLIATNNDTMSSREIADLTGKRHDHVMRDIKSLVEQGAIGAPSLGETSYTDKSNRKQSMYMLGFEATMTLVTGYDAKRRSQVIARWVELEKKEQDPVAALAAMSKSDILRLAADTAQENEKLKAEQEANAPKLALVSRIQASNKAIKIGDFVKLISIEGSTIGRNNFYKWLHAEAILTAKNMPYQRYIDNGWFEVSEGTYENKGTNGPRLCYTTLITGRGQVSLLERFKNSEKAPQFMNKNVCKPSPPKPTTTH